jgi:PAS domain S-box-containing protein
MTRSNISIKTNTIVEYCIFCTSIPISATMKQMRDFSSLQNWLKKHLKQSTAQHSRDDLTEEFEQFFHYVFDNSMDGISILDLDYTILEVNKTMESWYSHMAPLHGRKCFEVYHNKSKPCINCPSREVIETGRSQTGNVDYEGPESVKGDQELAAFPLFDDDGEMFGILEYVRDITRLKEEEKVINNLKKRLMFQNRTLQEQEIALKVLMKKGNPEEDLLSDSVTMNMNTRIIPLLNTLRAQVDNTNALNTITILESRVKEILSPFLYRLSIQADLSPREMEIATLIREGRTSKEIASQLFITDKGVDFHRMNIRKKLGIAGQSTDLRSYLLRM